MHNIVQSRALMQPPIKTPTSSPELEYLEQPNHFSLQ